VDEKQTALLFIRAKRGGEHEANVPKDDKFERSEYIWRVG